MESIFTGDPRRYAEEERRVRNYVIACVAYTEGRRKEVPLRPRVCLLSDNWLNRELRTDDVALLLEKKVP